MDSELGDRGFGVGAIAANNASAAKSLGRFGRGGASEAAAKQAMMGQAMGLGDAGALIGGMGRLSAGGNNDPAEIMKKAMAEGLMKGLQDSRQFGELISAAQETSQGVGDFEGALKGVLTFAGSGRSNDVATAQAAALKAEERMSGKTGGWQDIVKFDITNRAAKEAISEAEGKGIELTREDRTSLQNLANMKPAELENEELVSSRLTSGAKAAIKASGKTIKQYGSKLATSARVHSAMDGAVNATQSGDLAELRNMLAEGDTEGIRKKYGNNLGRLQDLFALAGSGATADGTSQEAIGDQQAVINETAKALGVKPGALGGGMQRRFTGKGYGQAVADSAAAMTSSEQMGRGEAQISQNDMALGTVAARGPNGENRFAQKQSKTGEMYAGQRADQIKDITDMRTVKPADQVQRVDEAIKLIADGMKEMKEAFKDFSAQKMVVNATQDIVIQGANSIKGVILDNGLTQAATEAGKAIADTVKNAFGASGRDSAPPPPKPGAGKTAPGPVR